jgi:hypothetical protein
MAGLRMIGPEVNDHVQVYHLPLGDLVDWTPR